MKFKKDTEYNIFQVIDKAVRQGDINEFNMSEVVQYIRFKFEM